MTKSPDPETGKYLEKYAAEHDNVVLLNNETNMGFLPSVNRALKMAKNHIALVNTDVEVPEEWLERLMLPIFARDNIATTTPFTTCGTICSFPDFCRDNKLFEKSLCGRSMMNSVDPSTVSDYAYWCGLLHGYEYQSSQRGWTSG